MARGRVSAEVVEPGAKIPEPIVAMWMGLIRSNSDRVHAGEWIYSVTGNEKLGGRLETGSDDRD